MDAPLAFTDEFPSLQLPSVISTVAETFEIMDPSGPLVTVVQVHFLG